MNLLIQNIRIVQREHYLPHKTLPHVYHSIGRNQCQFESEYSRTQKKATHKSSIPHTNKFTFVIVYVVKNIKKLNFRKLPQETEKMLRFMKHTVVDKVKISARIRMHSIRH